MALIFLGKTPCSICGKTLQETSEIISWGAFLNKTYQLWKYSDSGMHIACFDNWEHKDEFTYLYQYQPLLDFEDPNTIKMIEDHGMPEWMRKIKEFRESIQ